MPLEAYESEYHGVLRVSCSVEDEKVKCEIVTTRGTKAVFDDLDAAYFVNNIGTIGYKSLTSVWRRDEPGTCAPLVGKKVGKVLLCGRKYSDEWAEALLRLEEMEEGR
ncbi:MAG: hypothetical protein B6D63_01720 [Candidatus Latescibacteria bacterium 4484_7]|nr:MAG: hypothetical protein B6D63_01720 [Candidatus Latescibacteria bacterium 4484_7]